MPLAKEKKKKIISDFRQDRHDTGSVEVQVALLTENINSLAEHFKAHVRDNHSRYGLIKMVGKRKRLLSYLQETDGGRYRDLIARLDLRK